MDNMSNGKLEYKRHASFYKLNKNFINKNDLLYWSCVNGHYFHYIPKDIHNGKWCKSCPEIVYVDSDELPVLIKDKNLTYKKQMEKPIKNIISDNYIWPIHEQFYNHYKCNCNGGMSRPNVTLPFREINIDYKLK